MNFTFINEFTPNDSEELVVDNPRPTGEDKGDQVQAPNSESKGAKAKKAKTGRGSRNKLAIFESDDEDHQPQSLSVRAYLHLETTSQQQGRSKKSNMVMIMKSTQCNPSIFTIYSSFKAFVREVASAAKTMTSNLTLSRLRWTFETTDGLPTKLLTDEVGFQAMLDAVQERTKGHTIFLYLPKPVDLEGDKSIKQARPPPNSPMTMFAAYGAYAKGEDYTPGSHGGSGLRTASTDYEGSTPSRSGPDPSFFTHQLPHPPPPPSYFHPPYYPYQYSYYPLSNAVHPPTAQPHPSSAPLVPAPETGSATDSYPSRGITTKHSVMLDAFCAKFVVSASDSEKLSELGYNPGNRIVESLTMGDWQSVGFTLLSWRTFLSHHRKFCDSIIAGT
ncbi:hypothetical protein BDR06DRAFT_1014271 [Suillus hirtellus]|nr:hypothetical protein BDR06DRAFT_1014271 [Suillus hirtellus]